MTMQKTTTSSVENSDGTQPREKHLTPDEAKARLKTSTRRFYAVLDGVNKPLSIGIHKQLREALPGIPSKHFQHLIFRLTTSKSYLHATINASCRYDLQNVESELLDKDKALAQTKLDAFKQKKKAKQHIPNQLLAPKVTVKKRRTLSLKGANHG